MQGASFAIAQARPPAPLTLRTGHQPRTALSRATAILDSPVSSRFAGGSTADPMASTQSPVPAAVSIENDDSYEQLDPVVQTRQHVASLARLSASLAMAFQHLQANADGSAEPLPMAMLERLQALELAQRTGAPLSTAEVQLLLGARPGKQSVVRGGVRARRKARNLWVLERYDGEDDHYSGFNRRRF